MTITLENAKKLYKVAKEHGVNLPDSVDGVPLCDKCFWVAKLDGLEGYYCDRHGNKKHWLDYYSHKEWLCLYTTDELLEWLPAFIERKTEGFVIDDKIIEQIKTFNLNIRKVEPYFLCFYSNIRKGREEFLFEVDAKTPADALCKLAIKLIEEGVIK